MKDEGEGENNGLPRKGLLDSMPRKSLWRVILLLLALGAVIVLQRKTNDIAGCMGQAFMAPAPVPARQRADAGDSGLPAGRVKIRVEVPATAPTR